MKLNTHTLNHADGGGANMDAYAFNTLWQEITNGITSIGNTIVNGLQVTERTKQIREYFNFKTEEDRHSFLSTLVTSNDDSDFGYYLIVIIILVALAGGLVFAIKYKK